MRLHTSEYMAWAKENIHNARSFDLTQSGMPVPPREALPMEDLPVMRRHCYGCPELKEAIAAAHGVAANRVLLSGGTSMTNFLVAAALLSPGDRVLMEEPTYEPLRCAFLSLEVQVAPLPRPRALGFQPDLEDLDARLAGVRLVVLTNLHNPSGVTLEPERLRTILAAGERAGATVLIDQDYLEFEETPPNPPYLPHVVTTQSLTKVYGLGGLRVGWAVGPRELIARAEHVKNVTYTQDPHMTQELGYRVYRDREPLRARNRAIADRGRAMVARWVQGRGLSFSDPRAGIVAVLELPQGLSGMRLSEHLKQAHDSNVVPGEFFGLPGCVRIGYGMETDRLEEALRRLGLALDELDPRVPSQLPTFEEALR